MTLPYDLSLWGRAAMTALVIFAVASGVMTWNLFGAVGLFQEAFAGTVTDDEYLQRAQAMNDRGERFWYPTLGMMYACLALCGLWIYRATANGLAAHPVDGAITPTMAVVWYVVPFANLILPYKATVQTWEGLHQGRRDWPTLGLIWWALWGIWLVGNVYANGITRTAETFEDFYLATIIDLCMTLIIIPTALLFAKLIKDMTDASADLAQVSPDLPDLKEQQP